MRRQRAGERLAELDLVEVTIEKLVAGGDGLGRFEGIPIFVPRAVPGDRVTARLSERRPDYGRAEIVEVLAPGDGRRQAPCPHFGRCGGCDLQQLEDARQVELKASAVRETLRRLGGVDDRVPVEVVAGEPWAYRLRTQVQVDYGGGRARVGYFARGSRELVEVGSCPVLAPELEAALERLGERLPAGGPRRLDLAVGDGGEVTCAPVVEGLPRGELALPVGDFVYRFDARCFFQAHRGLLPTLVERAVGPWRGETAFDLYGGVGLFSLPLARRYDAVEMVEGDRVAARYARTNAREGRTPGLRVVHRAVESWIGRLPGRSERVVVDPPRTGLPPVVRGALREKPPERLTYVSCAPATLARDLKGLAGRFAVESLCLLDMFPQTGHMEVVAQLRRA